MNKTAKIIIISLLSVIGLTIVGIFIALSIIFSSSKLTPIVRKEGAKYLKGEMTLDHVELTFFSTFPRFGIEIDNLCLKNPMQGAPSDTLAYMKSFKASVDIMALWKKHELILHHFDLKDGLANVFINQEGKANFDIMKSTDDEDIDETPADTTATESFLKRMDLQSIGIENFYTHYVDEQQKIDALVDGLNLFVKGGWNAEPMSSVMKFGAEKLYLTMNDSTLMRVNLNKSEINFKGDLSKSEIDGKIELNIPELLLQMGADTLVDNQSVEVNIPLEANIDNQSVSLKQSMIKFADLAMNIEGDASMQKSGAIDMDMKFDLSDWNVKKILSYVPSTYLSAMKDIDVDGQIAMNGHVYGSYHDSIMPLVDAELKFSDGELLYTGYPKFEDIQSELKAYIDMNEQKNSNIDIKNFSLRSKKSSVKAQGSVKDCMNAMLCDMNMNADINLPDWYSVVPKDMKVKMDGQVAGKMHTKFSIEDVTKAAYQKVNLNGELQLKHIDVLYQDSMGVKIPEGKLAVLMPSTSNKNKNKESAHVKMNVSELMLDMIGTLQSQIKGADVSMDVSDFMATNRMPTVACQFDMNTLNAQMDTIHIGITQPSGKVNVVPSKSDAKNPSISCQYTSESIQTMMGAALAAKTARVDVNADVDYDPQKKEVLSQWNPKVDVNLHQGDVVMNDIMTMQIPQVKFRFTPNKMVIDESQIRIKDSDFSLSGIITNINEYLENKGLLTANLDFVSNNTAVDQLMDLANGFGRTDSMNVAESKEANAQPVSPEDNPFMVPLGVDVRLNTKIKNASFGETSVQNVGGVLNIKDGVMVLEQMGFTNKAANMQLTAMYRSPRKNHLFVGMDFHLLNIDIAELIKMIPDIDTIVPMLKSFDGRAQFHLAAETYMKSNYDLKFSTLRGAAAIEGQDLVVMDNSTFSTISKWLRFNKKTRNKVDSLDVEMTVFRNEVDLYPFLISMDKYKAVISGRHNLDMNFDYHISLTDCPLPIRLGLEITGNMDKLKYKLVPCKYANLYRPQKRNAVQTQTLALKKMISDALKKSVKPIPTAQNDNNE